MADETKPIQVNVEIPVYDKLTELSDRFRLGRGPICELSLEVVLPQLESGEMIYLNGKFVPSKKRAA